MFNSITYSGTVAIKIKNKPTIYIKNTASRLFFKTLISLLISGLQNNLSQLPTYMSICKETVIKEGNKLNSPAAFTAAEIDYDELDLLTLSPLPIVGREMVSSDDGIDQCLFTSLLPRSLLNSTKINDLKSGSRIFILLLNYDRRILACVETTYESISAVAQNAGAKQATLEWRLTFANRQETQEVLS